MATSNRITKVATVGAAGNVGKHITTSLLSIGLHTITALTHLSSPSQSTFPPNITIKEIDYNQPSTIISALLGNDVLIITLAGNAPKETQTILIEAAVKAGVKWILPNEWSPDTDNEELVRDIFVLQPKVGTRKAIENTGKSSYIAISTGFWYEWSLAMAAAFGIDFGKKEVVLFDEGTTRISVSTWPQELTVSWIGRAVAALLSLPVKAEGGNEEACLERFRNKVVYVNSFTVSQRDMLASALRVTGTKEEEWKIMKEPAKERYATGHEEIKEGKRIGFAKMMYTRVFYPDRCRDFEHGKGTLNVLLGLPKEDIDEATKVAIERSKTSNWVG